MPRYVSQPRCRRCGDVNHNAGWWCDHCRPIAEGLQRRGWSMMRIAAAGEQDEPGQQPEPIERRPTKDELKMKEAEAQRAEEMAEFGFVISDSEPPPPAKGQRIRSPVVASMMMLKPGQHIEIDLKRAGIAYTTMNAHVGKVRKLRGLNGDTLFHYKAENGNVIVKYAKAKESKQS